MLIYRMSITSKRRGAMKKLFLGISVLLALGMMASVAVAGVGNTIPVNGKHYNLNIIGVRSDKDVGDSKGHTLFVPLNDKCKIVMTQDPDGEFLVVDRNGTDGEAEFNIAPGYYNVYAAALGKKGGKVRITSWGEFEDALEGTVLLWLGSVKLEREKGKSPVSVNINELFYVDVTLCIATAIDPNTGQVVCTEEIVYEDYWVFDIPELIEYYWDYDNKGLKLLQVRFYPCTIDPTGQADDYCRWEDGTPIDPKSYKRSLVTLAPPSPKSNVTTTWGDIKE
jgi:hypothetical protein